MNSIFFEIYNTIINNKEKKVSDIKKLFRKIVPEYNYL
jgi:hypothetical protein